MSTQHNIIITTCIDWLRFTFSRDFDPKLLFREFPSLQLTGDILDFGYHGYNRSMPFTGGGNLMWHSEKREMKYEIDLPGQACAEIRRDGFEVEEIMTRLLMARVPDLTYKRIDYARDLHNSWSETKDLWDAYEAGNVKTTARKARYIRSYESEYAGDTIEFGTRQSSPRFLRIYNKAVQLGTLWESLIRTEVEMKKVRVNGFAASVIKHGRDKAGLREITEAVQTDVPWFQEVLKGETAPHMDVPRPESKPNSFTVKTIIPFIKNHSEELSEATKRKLLEAIRDYITLPG